MILLKRIEFVAHFSFYFSAKMLPVEVLRAVCGALSRDDLEMLMLVNALFRQLISLAFVQAPFRFVNQLSVSARANAFQYDDQYASPLIFVETHQLIDRLAHCRLGKIR